MSGIISFYPTYAVQEANVCDLKDIREAFGIEPVRFKEGLARFMGKT